MFVYYKRWRWERPGNEAKLHMLRVMTAALAIEYIHSRAMIFTAIAALVALNGWVESTPPMGLSTYLSPTPLFSYICVLPTIGA